MAVGPDGGGLRLIPSDIQRTASAIWRFWSSLGTASSFSSRSSETMPWTLANRVRAARDFGVGAHLIRDGELGQHAVGRHPVFEKTAPGRRMIMGETRIGECERDEPIDGIRV